MTSAHNGNFTQGQSGATYTVTVSNLAGAIATSGMVTVTETLPSGLTLALMTGPGWSCTSNTCTRSNVLNAGASYPAITVTVSVGASASSPQVNAVSVSGGGSATANATDSTVVQASGALSPVSVTPGSGLGVQQTFALQYADPLGAADLTQVWVWFTSNYNTVTVANSCIVNYTRASNQLFLYNDAGASGTSATLGTAGTLSNSQCSINAGTASVTTSGMNLTWNLPVTFTAAYAGAKGIDMYAAGSSTANSGWQLMGSWDVPPTLGLSVTSAHSGSFVQGQIATYSVTVTNAAGAVATSGMVTAADTPPSGLTLTSMTGTGWTCSGNSCTRSDPLAGGSSYQPITVTVNVAANATSPQVNAASVSGGGSTAASSADRTTIVVPTGPSTISVTPGSGSGTQQTFALQYVDPLGATDLAQVWVWFTSNYGTVPNSCLVNYTRATNQIFLYNDAGTGGASAALGVAGTLSNGSCSINTAAASVTSSGTNLTLNLPMTFTTAYAGTKYVYMYAGGRTPAADGRTWEAGLCRPVLC